ncbi:hypothetical protein CHS0354_013436 [Potamilus streckersoni]|nr:hypothetical protein CHS0354_013436 [Potamilus streckersoni]
MDELQVNGKQILEMHFYGFTSKRQVSNVMLYDAMKNQSDQISVNKNYTHRIERFKLNNGNLSFLLLNVNFMDSGKYTVSTLDSSVVKGKTSILVARQTILGQDGGLMNFTFMCNKTNISLIKIENIISKIHTPVVIYNVSQQNCTEFGYLFKNQIESCLFSGITFSFTIRRLTWLEKGQYVAWDDKNFLLDSVFLEIQDTKTSRLETTKGYTTLKSTVHGSTDSLKFAKENVSRVKWDMYTAYNDKGLPLVSRFINIQDSSLETRNEYQTSSTAAISDHDSRNSDDKPAWPVVSAVLVVVVAGFLAMIAMTKIRHRRVPITEAIDITYTNKRKPTADSSGNLYKNVKEAVPPKEARMDLVENNIEVNLTDNSNNKGLVKVRLQKENICYRQFDYADSFTRITRSFQIDSVAHLYDYISENNDHCWSYEPNFRSSPNSTESIAEPCVEYDYVRQHSFMTLRPPAPDPAVTRKTIDQSTRAGFISWHQRLSIKSNKSKSRRLAQLLNYDYPRSYIDHSSSMDKRHQRSQSLSDMMAIACVRWSRRSARTFTKKDCYNSL